MGGRGRLARRPPADADRSPGEGPRPPYVLRDRDQPWAHDLDASSATALDLASDDHHFFRPDEATGEAFHDTPEAERITQLWGDSATFDFSPYEGKVDLVYIDGAHTYDYVKADTANALRMLSPTGMIVWDDYGSNPGVYQLVNEVAATLDRPVYHVYGTRMAVYSRQDFVHRLPYDDHASLPTV